MVVFESQQQWEGCSNPRVLQQQHYYCSPAWDVGFISSSFVPGTLGVCLHLAPGFSAAMDSPCHLFLIHTLFLLSKYNPFIFVESDLLHLVPFQQFSKKIWNWILAGKVLVNLPTAIQPQALQVHIFVSLPKSQVPFLTTPGSWGVAHGPDLALIKLSRMF